VDGAAETATTAGLVAVIVALVEVIKLVVSRWTGKGDGVPNHVGSQTSERIEQKLDRALERQQTDPRQRSVSQQMMMYDLARGQERIASRLDDVDSGMTKVERAIEELTDEVRELRRGK
jgi:hypothetical protein